MNKDITTINVDWVKEFSSLGLVNQCKEFSGIFITFALYFSNSWILFYVFTNGSKSHFFLLAFLKSSRCSEMLSLTRIGHFHIFLKRNQFFNFVQITTDIYQFSWSIYHFVSFQYAITLVFSFKNIQKCPSTLQTIYFIYDKFLLTIFSTLSPYFISCYRERERKTARNYLKK